MSKMQFMGSSMTKNLNSAFIFKNFLQISSDYKV